MYSDGSIPPRFAYRDSGRNNSNTWFVPKVSVLIFYLIIYWTYLKLQVISFEV